jgi:glutamine amidotransferase
MIKKSKVCLIDLETGNLGSVKNILNYLNSNFIISNTLSDIKDCSHIILPGVGSFGSLMKKIKKFNFDQIFEDQILAKKKYYLGICVGMQILATNGEEFGNFKGLGAIDGTVEKIKNENLPLPHIGWNNVNLKKKSKLFKNIHNNSDFYFVNSFAFNCKNKNDILSTTVYAYPTEFVSAIEKENIMGVQFHPEKSQHEGIQLIKNFISF